MCTAFGYRQLVMYFLSQYASAFLLAQLTERVLCYVSVSDPFPCSAILLVNIGCAFIPVIVSPRYSCMVFTVLVICQFGTAGVSARPFGFSRHKRTFFLQQKSPRSFLQRLHVCYSMVPLYHVFIVISSTILLITYHTEEGPDAVLLGSSCCMLTSVLYGNSRIYHKQRQSAFDRSPNKKFVIQTFHLL